MPTVLFGPSVSGLAHVIRCLGTAERLPNCKCIIIVEPGHIKFILKNYTPPKHITFIEHSAKFYNDTKFWNQALKHKIPPKIILSEIYYYLKITRKIKPDLVISDSNFFSAMAAFILKNPLVILTVMSLVPHQKTVIRFTSIEPLQRFIDAVLSRIVNKIIIDIADRAFLDIYKRENLIDQSITAKALLDDFDKVLFDDPRSTSLSPKTPNLAYFPLPIAKIEIGSQATFRKLKQLTKGKRSVYINLGGTSFNPELVKSLVVSFLDAGYFVICSTVFDVRKEDLPNSSMLYCDSFIPGYLVASLVDVMVSHGSQGTINQAIQAKTPLIAIPFHVDQYLMLNIQNNPLIKTVLPINLRLIARLQINPALLLKLPDKINPLDIVAIANKTPRKANSLKNMPKANANSALVEHIMAKINTTN